MPHSFCVLPVFHCVHVSMQACLKWDPQERLTPEEALQHPWVQSIEPAAPAPVPVLTPASTGWTPRNLNPSSTWLSVCDSYPVVLYKQCA
jgi:serine/threonine protein kinase